MSANDNVIPFPGRWNDSADESAPDSAAQPSRRATELDSRRRARRLPEPRRRPAEVSTFVLTVQLDDCDPTIWRRLEVASDVRLDQFHEVLQGAMGWTGSHLHQFTIGPGARDPRVLPFLSAFDEHEGEDGVPERDVRLDQVLAVPGDLLHYDYDFGDGWQHTVALHEVLPHNPGAQRAMCLAGARSCPPEECGGVDGYGDILTALAAPELADDELRRRLAWLPEGFDPATFSVEATNALLAATVRLSDRSWLDRDF